MLLQVTDRQGYPFHNSVRFRVALARHCGFHALQVGAQTMKMYMGMGYLVELSDHSTISNGFPICGTRWISRFT